MTKQRGQSVIEFALIAPVFFLMCFGMIYAGILFMDYLNYNNAARSLARVASIEGAEKAISDKNQYITPLTDLYVIANDDDIYIGPPKNDNGTVIEATKDTDIEVIIQLKLKADLPRILVDVGFPPEELKPIKYVMKRETT